MKVLRTKTFLYDLERQYGWYLAEAGEEVAERYLQAVEQSVAFLSSHPLIGPMGGFSHPKLANWRHLLVNRPFSMHVLFYGVEDEQLTLRRAMRARRDLPRRLVENG